MAARPWLHSPKARSIISSRVDEAGGGAMLGLAVGLLCGALELYLLSRLTYALTHEGSVTQMALLFFMKFLVLAGALALGVWLWRGELVWMASGMAAVLILGAIILFVRSGRKDRKGGGKV